MFNPEVTVGAVSVHPESCGCGCSGGAGAGAGQGGGVHPK